MQPAPLLFCATRPSIPPVLRGRAGRAIGAAAVVAAAVLSSAPAASAQPGPISVAPARGPVGATVVITGSGLATATDVLFGSTAATFTVDSDDQITATVPNGATAGPIEVDTGGGSGESEPFFLHPNIPVILTHDPRRDTLPTMPPVTSELGRKGPTFAN